MTDSAGPPPQPELSSCRDRDETARYRRVFGVGEQATETLLV